MGCNNSKNKVHIVGEAPLPAKTNNVTGKASGGSAVNRSGRRPKSGSQRSVGQDSVLSENRGNSASSKVSKHTMDSGYEDVDYKHVITEESDPDRVKQIEEGFDTPRGLELGVCGQAVVPTGSAQDKERLDEQRILAALHEEGLIQRPVAKKQAGISFEVIAMGEDGADMFGAPRRPPPRLEKLEKRRKKKKELTEEEVAAKLARAEERRLAREQERLERVKVVTYKYAGEVTHAQDQQLQDLTAQFQREKTKLDVAQENRDKRMEELREKQRIKKERREAARQKKLAAAMAAAEAAGAEEGEREDEEAIFGKSKPKMTEDSPIIVVKPASSADTPW